VKSEPTIPPQRRLLVVGPVAAVFVFMMAVIFVAQYNIRANPSLEMLDGLLGRITIFEGQLNVAQVKRDVQGAADIVRRRDALLVYSGDRFDAVIADPHTWSGPVNMTLRTRAQRARQMALAASTDSRRASAAIVADIVSDVEQRMQRRRSPAVDLALFVGGFGCTMIAVLGMFGIVLAAVCRAPIAVRLVGGALVTADGRRASRSRATLRSLVAWTPALVGFAIVFLSRNRGGSDLVRGIAGAISLLVTAAVGGAGLVAARFSLPDRFARTHIVPR